MGAITQRAVIEFACIMAAEFPRCDGLPGKLNDLLKLARRYGFLQERACNESVPENHDAKCEARIRAHCESIGAGCVPVFSGDPRGATVKLRVPSGRTNDWGATGICVPGS
jgi:hypothetical protein